MVNRSLPVEGLLLKVCLGLGEKESGTEVLTPLVDTVRSQMSLPTTLNNEVLAPTYTFGNDQRHNSPNDVSIENGGYEFPLAGRTSPDY